MEIPSINKMAFISLLCLLYTLALVQCGDEPEYEVRQYLKIESLRTAVIADDVPASEHRIDLHAKSFHGLMENSTVFIDRTAFIKAILTIEESCVIVTAPTKSGKSINLDMLRMFIEMKVDKFGQPIPREDTLAYNVFKYNEILRTDGTIKSLKSPLIISNHTYYIDKYLVRYPVIYLNFSGLTGNSFAEIQAEIHERIMRAFHDHSYILEMLKNADSTESQFIFKKYLSFLNRSSESMGLNFDVSLRNLGRIVAFAHRRPVYLMIDDYDAPIIRLLHNTFLVEEDVKQIYTMARYLYKGTLERNSNFYRTVLTGTLSCGLRLVQSSILQYYSLTSLHNPLFSFFIISHDDANTLYNLFDIPTPQREEAEHWYAGIKLGFRSSGYNTWSLLNFLHRKEIENYWQQVNLASFFNKIMLRLYEVRRIYERIVHGETTLPKGGIPSGNNTWDGFHTLRNVLQVQQDVILGVKMTKMVLLYLNDNLYLTYNRSTVSNLRSTRNQHIIIPNEEIRSVVINRMEDFYVEMGIKPNAVDNLAEQLEQFIMQDDISSEPLRQAIQDSVTDLDVKNPDYVEGKNVSRFSHKTLQSLTQFLALKMRFKYHWEAYPFNIPGLKLYKLNPPKVAVIKCNFYSHLPEQILNATVNDRWFSNIAPFEEYKFIVFDFDENKQVHLISEIRKNYVPPSP